MDKLKKLIGILIISLFCLTPLEAIDLDSVNNLNNALDTNNATDNLDVDLTISLMKSKQMTV